MKQIILSLAGILAFSFAGAQNSDTQAITLNTATGHVVIGGPDGHIHAFNPKPFELSVSAGFSEAFITFPSAELTSYGKAGWSAGLTAQYNQGFLGYRIGAFYETANSSFPDQTNVFGSTLTYRQSALDIPLSFIIQNGHSNFRIYCGLGGSIRYQVDSSLKPLNYKTNQIQWGLNFVWGMRFGHFFFEDYFFHQLNDLFDEDAGAPKSATIGINAFKIGWVF